MGPLLPRGMLLEPLSHLLPKLQITVREGEIHACLVQFCKSCNVTPLSDHRRQPGKFHSWEHQEDNPCLKTFAASPARITGISLRRRGPPCSATGTSAR